MLAHSLSGNCFPHRPWRSFLHFENTQLGRLVSAPGTPRQKALNSPLQNGCPGARDRGNTGAQFVVVGVPLLDEYSPLVSFSTIKGLTLD